MTNDERLELANRVQDRIQKLYSRDLLRGQAIMEELSWKKPTKEYGNFLALILTICKNLHLPYYRT